MIERLKDFIARHVFHPLQGMVLGDWLSLLRQHRFAIDPRQWPRALVQTTISLNNSVHARLERRRYGRRIEETAVIILESLKERDEAAKNARNALI